MNELELKQLKRDMRTGLYDAEYNACLFDLLFRRYHRIDTATKVTLATVAATSVVAMKFTQHQAWPAINALTVIVTTGVLPILKWNKLIPRIEAERVRWIGLKQEYQNAWDDAKSSADWDEAAKELRRIRKRDNTAEKNGGVIPNHRGLAEIARRKVCRAHGVELS